MVVDLDNTYRRIMIIMKQMMMIMMMMMMMIKVFYATLYSSRIFTHGGAPQTFSSLKINLNYCHFHRSYAHLFLFTYIIIIIIIPNIFIIISDINLYILPRSTTMQNLEVIALKLAELLQFQK